MSVMSSDCNLHAAVSLCYLLVCCRLYLFVTLWASAFLVAEPSFCCSNMVGWPGIEF
jgi:hypothetical protein